MPKDYKDSGTARADSRLSHPLLLGMIIGLLLGIVISLAVALWLNRLSNPFIERGKAVRENVARFLSGHTRLSRGAELQSRMSARSKSVVVGHARSGEPRVCESRFSAHGRAYVQSKRAADARRGS